MKQMKNAQLRAAFLDYFRKRGHAVQPSSSLVPSNDATLLFTNAGMVPFKDVFLGRKNQDFKRAASSQRCVRAGGKHNDLENVGYTARHHTFFEMLGNFSFGDYFKKEAIHYAWDFLTVVLEIPAKRLWVTVFDEDQETEDIWLKAIGINPSRLSRIGAQDNFWSMGDIGPCGPCTEIFFDHGEHVSGSPPGTPEEDGDRYIEIWNLVFMQYDRSADGSLKNLPKPSVDTGMGLERLAAVLQNVHNNYQTDLFQGLLKAIATIAKTEDVTQSSLRVIVDHIRSCAFMIVDGVMPSNEGRGYVLRRIIRRAIRHGYRLDICEVFFYKLVAPLIETMGVAYPELVDAQEQVERVLKKEEQRFGETLQHGMEILETCIDKLQGQVIPGDIVFLLYDTYGFPVDLTADYAREKDLEIDRDGFEKAMQAQRDRARSASGFGADYAQDIVCDRQTEFTGYLNLAEQAKITGLFKNGVSVDALSTGEDGVVVLDKTPFYAESGGQIGDVGEIIADANVFTVSDTQKQGNHLFLHKGQVSTGKLTLGLTVAARVETSKRLATALNHSATHLLHAALRQELGDHVNQKGSLVNPEYLRFDFSHFEPLTDAVLKTLERIVNQQIRLNNKVSAEVMAKDQAMQVGAMALFGEKYGDEVRVLRIGEFSIELCGGIHADRAGDIGFFRIVGETGVAAGVRRIEAVTGATAIEWNQAQNQALADVAMQVKSSTELAAEKVGQLIKKNKSLEKQLDKLKAKLASNVGGLDAQAVDIDGIKVLAAKVEGVDNKTLRNMLDQLKNKLGSSAIVLATVDGDKVSLIAGVSKDQIKYLKAGDLVNAVATKVGGKGGGRPDMAQAGGNNPEALAEALKQVPDWVREQFTAAS